MKLTVVLNSNLIRVIEYSLLVILIPFAKKKEKKGLLYTLYTLNLVTNDVTT